MSHVKKYKTGLDLRAGVRTGAFRGQTAGQAPNHLQGNIVILPKRYAQDFLLYCANNPKPCPVIGISKPGDPRLPDLGSIDIRSDVPSYRVFKDGELETEVADISALWRSDLVTFVLGCSFTFEEALISNGYPVRHIEAEQNVPMFRTSLETMPGGIFQGPLVVTMRSYPSEQIPAIYGLSANYPHAHGTPVYWGAPEAIGIKDLSAPEYGDPIQVPEGETPVFWACGVTPQAAISRAKPDFCITHAPGCMLVTDVASDMPPKVDQSISPFWQSKHNVNQNGE